MSNDSASIVAAGHTRFVRLDDTTLEDFIVQTSREVLQDGNIDASEVDASFLRHFNSGLAGDAFPESLVLQADPALRLKQAT